MNKKSILVLSALLALVLAIPLIWGCGEGVKSDDDEPSPSAGPTLSEVGPKTLWVVNSPIGVTPSIITSIEVSWKTDVPATTKLIYYCSTMETGTMFVTEETTLTMTHEVVVTGLSSEEFCFRAASKNQAGQETISGLDSPVLYLLMSPPGVSSVDADTYLDQFFTGLNYGKSPILIVGDSAVPSEFRALLNFDISSVPTNRVIVNADLMLYMTAESIAAGFPIDVYGNTEPQWFEGVDINAITASPEATWASGLDWPPGAVGPPWVAPGPYRWVPPQPVGGGSPTPPLNVVPVMVGGAGPRYYYIGDVGAGFGLPSGFIVVYNVGTAPGGLPDTKTFHSRDCGDPSFYPGLKLWLTK